MIIPFVQLYMIPNLSYNFLFTFYKFWRGFMSSSTIGLNDDLRKYLSNYNDNGDLDKV